MGDLLYYFGQWVFMISVCDLIKLIDVVKYLMDFATQFSTHLLMLLTDVPTTLEYVPIDYQDQT